MSDALLAPAQMPPPLSKELYDELTASIRGPVYARPEQNDVKSDFTEYSAIFNGNVLTLAKAVVCPLDADDMSRVIIFCNKHSLSPSIKAGGYGTAGWAINGEIIVDLSRLVEIDIEAPNEDGSFTSLKDTAPANSKGKRRVGEGSSGTSGPSGATPHSGKRRREEDAALRSYDSASATVAAFLSGSTPPASPTDQPPPTNRRRLETTPPGAAGDLYLAATNADINMASLSSSESSNSPTAGQSPASQVVSPATYATTPSPVRETGQGSPATSASTRLQASADPFAYLNAPSSSQPLPAVVQSSFSQPGPLRSWTAAGSTLAGSDLTEGLLFHAHAEPLHEHAYVTFGAGMRQKEIDRYTAQNKLEAKNGVGEGIPYHVPFSAHPVGSSIMMLGGFGFLSRLRGLSIDNLVEVEMVLADGQIVVVNENEHPDLWWAVRGAGPALGVATRYKARAFPVPVVFAGNIIYRFNRATAPSLIRHFRDCVKGAPRELYANAILTAGPAGKDSLVVIQMCYVGDKEHGQEFLSAISSWDGEKCMLNEVDEKSFLHQQDSVAQVLRGKAGRQWFIRSALISSLPDDLINETVAQFADTPVGCTWLFELAGGALTDFENTCVPKSQREAAFTIAALHQWEMNIDDDRCIDSAEEWIAGTLDPVHLGGPLPCFLGRLEPPERTKACFGDSWERLVEIKKKYDPSNIFRNSFWPLNAEGDIVQPNTHEPPLPLGLRR
ncbi:hypothetical protein BDN72DRAFT_845354 [Pluteus cervinus]|uniref:Uncharacterized protein n=1 Tax=Pluteus cervinus TaxID=181527 RepID=A0ACD3AIE7_9AGAR|nr:hypothetical protein BDN72DRAFT_845354 [Pluteus cervinus]